MSWLKKLFGSGKSSGCCGSCHWFSDAGLDDDPDRGICNYGTGQSPPYHVSPGDRVTITSPDDAPCEHYKPITLGPEDSAAADDVALDEADDDMDYEMEDDTDDLPISPDLCAACEEPFAEKAPGSNPLFGAMLAAKGLKCRACGRRYHYGCASQSSTGDHICKCGEKLSMQI